MKETDDPLLKGRINVTPEVTERFKKVELYEAIYLPIIRIFESLMRNRELYKLINKVVKP